MVKHIFSLGAFLFLCCWTLTGNAKNAQADLTEMSLEDLMDIEVYSASKKPERLFNTAAAVYVITPEDIRRSGATNIPDVLRMVPGINVQKVNARSWDISARGFNGSVFSNKLLVLIDGRAVYTPLYGGVFWDVQDVMLEDIERIEVIRGPGGTLWGANAVNGVINVITKKARDTQGGLASVGAGNEERMFSTVRYGGKSGQGDGDKDWFYRAYGKYFDRDEGYRTTGTANDEWQMGRAGFRAEKSHMTYQGDFYQGFLGQRVVETSFFPPYARVLDKASVVKGGNFISRYEDEESRLQAYWDLTNRDSKTFKETRNTFDLEYSRRTQASAQQELTWGLGYRVNLEDVQNTENVVIHRTKQLDQIFSLFAQDEIKMMEEKLRLIFGSKLEYNIYTHFEVQPNVRLSYAVNDRNLLWAAASRSVRTPSRFEVDGQVTSSTTTPSFSRVFGSHDLSSEEMRSFEVGYRLRPRQNIFLDLALFADHYDDLVTFISGNSFIENGFTISSVSPVNGMKGDIHGVELAGDVQLWPWWKIKSSYAFTKSSLSTHSDISASALERALERSFPRHNAYVRSSFDFPSAVELDLTLRYRDSFLGGVVPSHTGVDIRLGKTIKDWQLSVIGQNVFQDHHLEASGSGIGLTQVDRSIYGKITRKF